MCAPSNRSGTLRLPITPQMGAGDMNALFTSMSNGVAMAKDSEKWNIQDLHPGIPLSQISSFGERARSLFARSYRSSSAANENLIVLNGAIDMLVELEYHFDLFTQSEHQIPAIDQYDPSVPDPDRRRHVEAARFEVIAYLSAVGRFHYFIKSKFFTNFISNVVFESVERLIVFRHKYTAHRSFDLPRNDENPEESLMQARSLSSLMGEFSRTDINGNRAISYQIYSSKTAHVIFTPSVDHLVIISEAYTLIERLLSA
jgi:hypothetical protein